MQKDIKNIDKKKKENMKIPVGLHMELNKGVYGTVLTLQSVRAVTDITREEVIMRCGKGRVRVYGRELEVATYENRIVEISGKISGFELL